MRGLFCGTTVKNNEEYKNVIRFRMRIFILLGLVGIVTLIIALMAEYKWDTAIEEYMLGVYTGIGTGLFISSILLWIKHRLLLNNEDKLKESRLNNSDERLQEISSKAFQAGTIIMLITLYAVALIGGLFYPVLVKALLITVFAFLISYLIAYKIFEKRM